MPMGASVLVITLNVQERKVKALITQFIQHSSPSPSVPDCNGVKADWLVSQLPVRTRCRNTRGPEGGGHLKNKQFLVRPSLAKTQKPESQG